MRTTFDFPAEFHRDLKLYAVGKGTDMREEVMRAVNLLLAGRAPLSPVETARAELLAVGEEFGLERAIAHLRAAQRARATAA